MFIETEEEKAAQVLAEKAQEEFNPIALKVAFAVIKTIEGEEDDDEISKIIIRAFAAVEAARVAFLKNRQEFDRIYVYTDELVASAYAAFRYHLPIDEMSPSSEGGRHFMQFAGAIRILESVSNLECVTDEAIGFFGTHSADVALQFLEKKEK